MFFYCLLCIYNKNFCIWFYCKLMVEQAILLENMIMLYNNHKNCKKNTNCLLTMLASKTLFYTKKTILALGQSLTEKIPHTSSDDWKDAKQCFWRSKSQVAIIHHSWCYKEIKPSWREVFNGQRCLAPKSGQIGETGRKISSWRPPMEWTLIKISDRQYYLLFTIV